MSVNMNSTPMNDPSTSESETPMFTAIPAWERNRKRRGFGGGKSRSAAASPAMGVDEAPNAAYAAPLESTESTFAAAPAYATRPVKRSGGVAPLAIAAGILAVGGLAAAGWYATQPHESGVAQLTPGTEAVTAPAAAPALVANTAPMPMPAPEPAAATTTTTTTKAAAPVAKTTTTTRVAAARTRPAPVSHSAEDAGVNTSATLPAAPQPYSGAAVAPSAPADVTPAPAPVEAAPQPVNPTPAPPQTAVTPPTAVNPPVATPPQ